MHTSLVEHIEPLPDDQSILLSLNGQGQEDRPGRPPYLMGIRNGEGHVYRLVLAQGVGETVRLVRALQKLGFAEEDHWSPTEGCRSTFRRNRKPGH